MRQPKISDIPSIKETLEQARNLARLRWIMPILRPILGTLRVDTQKMDETLAMAGELAKQMEKLASMMDRFNELFAEQGWIIYGNIDLDIVKAAIEKAELGDLKGGEAILVDYYSADTVRFLLRQMHAVTEFQPRMRLAEKALVDYEEQRYHACIPVILAMIDGLVSELHYNRRGFFAESTDLTAWDSMAAHPRGLNVLARLFKRGRRTTVTDSITIPYRHGIMHGMDLGYDNRIVAAKTWAALFAVKDWALKAEQGRLTTPPKAPEPSWGDIMRQLADNEAKKEQVAQWKPRNIQIGVDIPNTGDPSLFPEGTPEKKLAEYLAHWGRGNFGYMAKCLSQKLGPPATCAILEIREVFASKILEGFAFSRVHDEAPAITVIEANLTFEESGHEVCKSQAFRLIYEDPEGNPLTAGSTGGEWSVITWAVHA